MQSSAVIMFCNLHWIVRRDSTSSPQKKGGGYGKSSRIKKLYVKGEYKGFNLLSHYKNTSLLSLL